MPDYSTGSARRREQYAKWARLLDSILPPPDENRLVPVADVGPSVLSLVEGSLADVGLTPVVSESRSMSGEPRYRVLVPARDAEVAGRVVAGF
jgi:hypothetical protein